MRIFFGWLLTGLVLLLLIATVIPHVDVEFWWLRAVGFPRLQILILAILALAALIPFYWRGVPGKIGVGLLSLVAIYQLIQIVPYTFVAGHESLAATSRDPSRRISVMVANVMSRNREPEGLISAIRRNSPDIVLTLETDGWWLGQFELIRREYPHRVDFAIDNGSGMILLSRRPLRGDTVRFLTEDSIPSIRTTVVLPSSEEIDLYGVHPPHPVSGSGSTEEEIVRIGREVKDRGRPAIVLGDFNDVSWSPTTSRFQEVSGMLDPRVGRGLYNTFHARLFFLRYPVDQIFHTPDFRLGELRRLPDIASDHFPLYASFQLQPEALQQEERRGLN